MYQKEIIYMGLHKNGNRLGSAGFLKVENKDMQSRLFLKLQNLPRTIDGRFPIRIYNGADWKEIDGVSIRDGYGVWEECANSEVENMRLQIRLPEGYLIEGQSRAAEQKRKAQQDKIEEPGTPMYQVHIEDQKAASNQEEIADKKTIPHQERAADQNPVLQQEQLLEHKSDTQREPENVHVTHTCQGTDEGSETSDKNMAQDIVDAWKKTMAETQPETWTNTQRKVLPKRNEPARMELAEMEMPQPCNLKEDKWEQILSSYERIHPYGDERVYVKLQPKDFIILQSKYQHLVNNSFLLHGFYNYRYVILGKEDDYYLGVPGVFYEREKMVALMFGFEAFECPGGNAKAGEFGYYLRKVEL